MDRVMIVVGLLNADIKALYYEVMGTIAQSANAFTLNMARAAASSALGNCKDGGLAALMVSLDLDYQDAEYLVTSTQYLRLRKLLAKYKNDLYSNRIVDFNNGILILEAT